MNRPLLRSLTLLAAMSTGCCNRNATIRPDLTIRVVDGNDVPVAGARVTVVHRTYPHGWMRDWWSFETGQDGTVATTRLRRREWVNYLMMHGVTFHEFFVCAGKGGRGVEIVRVEGDRVDLRLHDDYADDCANVNAYRAGGNLGWKLTTAELEQARKRVEPLPSPLPTDEP